MTATTAPQDLASESWNALLKITAIVALFVVLVAGSFALGRGTADDTVTIVRHSAPAVSVDTAAPASCDHTATPQPC